MSPHPPYFLCLMLFPWWFDRYITVVVQPPGGGPVKCHEGLRSWAGSPLGPRRCRYLAMAQAAFGIKPLGRVAEQR